MPQVIATTVYRLEELPEGAKDRARTWYREGGFDYDWYDAVYEDFQRIAEILGIRLRTRATRLVSGRIREDLAYVEFNISRNMLRRGLCCRALISPFCPVGYRRWRNITSALAGGFHDAPQCSGPVEPPCA